MDRVHDPLAEHEHGAERVERRAQHGRAPGDRLGAADDGPGGGDAEDREDGQEPAAEEPLLRAHEEDVEDRRGHEDERQAAVPHEHPDPAEDAGDERDPAEAPRERPQVVELAGGLRQPELAEVVLGGRGLVVEPVAERREVEDRERVRDDERAEREQAREDEAAERGRAGVAAGGRLLAPARRDELQAAGREQRQEHDAPGVLRRARQAEADPGERVVEQAPAAQDAGRAPQRQRDRRERRDVVEREVRVEDRQERDRQERRGQQADAAVAEARGGEVQQPHRQRPDDGGRDARDDEHLGRDGPRRCSRRPRGRRTTRRTRRAAGTCRRAG